MCFCYIQIRYSFLFSFTGSFSVLSYKYSMWKISVHSSGVDDGILTGGKVHHIQLQRSFVFVNAIFVLSAKPTVLMATWQGSFQIQGHSLGFHLLEGHRVWHQHVSTPLLTLLYRCRCQITPIPASLHQPRLSVAAHLNCRNGLPDMGKYSYDTTWIWQINTTRTFLALHHSVQVTKFNICVCVVVAKLEVWERLELHFQGSK